MRLLNRSAGRLSRHRRRTLAGLVVMLLGLLLTGGLYAAFAPAQAGPAQGDQQQVAAGRKLFLVGCASCHGQYGQGVLTKSGTQYGPALAGVGAAAVDFQVGTGRMPLSQPGQQAEKKPAVYSQEEIDQLAAYVASLGPGPAVPDQSAYGLDGLSAAERQAAVARGGQLFLSNCTACHNFAGSGGALSRGGQAPQIRGIDPKYVYEAMLTGPQQMPTFSNGNLTPQEKRDIIAYLATLEDTPDYGGLNLGNLGPVAEGAVGWLVGIGVLVGFAVWIAAHTTRSSKQKADT